jgi:hypothetical protein
MAGNSTIKVNKLQAHFFSYIDFSEFNDLMIYLTEFKTYAYILVLACTAACTIA